MVSTVLQGNKVRHETDKTAGKKFDVILIGKKYFDLYSLKTRNCEMTCAEFFPFSVQCEILIGFLNRFPNFVYRFNFYRVAMALVMSRLRASSFFLRSSGVESSTSS